MQLSECKTREQLASFNQLKIFLYTLAAKYAPLFGGILSFIEPRGHPFRAEMSFSGPALKDRKATGYWSLRVIAQTKYLPGKNNHKKYHIFLDYRREFPEDLACCGQGLQRLVIFGAMKLFHLEAVKLSERYNVLTSGEWPHESIGLGLYLANEYPEIEMQSVEAMNNLIRSDYQMSADESAAMMD